MRMLPMIAAIAAVSLLPGCGQPPAGGNATAPSAAPGDDVPAESGDKFNGYVKGYNTLVSTFGLEPQYETYLGQRIQQKGINDSFIINVGWLDNALDELKTARAVPCKCRGLDEAGDRMVPVLERLVGRLKGLETYYASRAYYQDDLARGKREDPLVIADFRAAMSLMQPLSDAIDAVQAKNDAAELATLKREGDMVGYNGALALQRSKALIGMFDAPEDARDPNQLRRADALAAEVEAALGDARAALDKSKGASDPDNGLRNSMYDTVIDRLTGMVGQYRGFRRSRSTADYQMMVASFNDAVEHANYSQ
jgi:hypothetical protein